MTEHDIVLAGGTVIDPETGLEGVRDVAVDGDRITAVADPGSVTGRTVVDTAGLLVCPGFIDLHSHSHTIAGHRLQVLDGVTTALELEGGLTPVERGYEAAAAEGRPANFGFSASWGLARMSAVAGFPADADLTTFLAHINDPAWQRPATPTEVDDVLAMLARDLADGALGIGVLVGYAPAVDPDEYLAVARLAAEAGVPTYTHARELVEIDPDVRVDGATEVVRAAAETGAHMHYCHVNSTSVRHVDRVLGLVEECQREGSRVTTEAYPYGAGMTGIGAVFLEPELLPRFGLTPSSLIYAPTGERVADEAALRRLRADDPGGLVIVEFLDERDEADRATLLRSLAFDDAIVASDAMPLTWPSGTTPDPLAWPLPAGIRTHPRTAGTFARSLRRLTGDAGLSWPEAVRRCTLLPAQALEAAAPVMRRKGRVQAGCDADITVVDPATLSDQATYEDSTRTSTGVEHVLVAGQFVVRDAALLTDALPGRPIRSEPL